MKFFFPIIFFASVFIFATCESSNSDASKNPTPEISDEWYLTNGKKIAAATFATLSGNLQKAMKEGGVANAIQYCNLSASPLVDSLEKEYQVKIKRTSLQLRNPKNKPNPAEQEQLQAYKKQMEKTEKLQPVLKKNDSGNISFFAPIHIMPLCEKCHGTVGETLSKKDYQVIQNYYPEDKAIGYVSGDWRGMWSITFDK